jgi:hypothetical protein
MHVCQKRKFKNRLDCKWNWSYCTKRVSIGMKWCFGTNYKEEFSTVFRHLRVRLNLLIQADDKITKTSSMAMHPLSGFHYPATHGNAVAIRAILHSQRESGHSKAVKLYPTSPVCMAKNIYHLIFFQVSNDITANGDEMFLKMYMHSAFTDLTRLSSRPYTWQYFL